jgi:hypothetical protein
MHKLLRAAAVTGLALLTIACGSRANNALTATPSVAPGPTIPRDSIDPLAASFAANDGTMAYDAASRRAFVVNRDAARVDILDVTDPTAPQPIGAIDVSPYGQEPASVAIHNGLLAIGVEADKKPADGTVLLANTNGVVLNDLRVGPLPAALAFTPDGTRLVVANQGLPNKEYTKNPEGSISIIALEGDPASVSRRDVRNVGFSRFNNIELDPRIRVIGPNATVAQDLEPDAIAIAPDGRTARIVLHKNNAMALVDLDAAAVTALLPLESDAAGATAQALRNLPIADLPLAGITVEGQPVTLGGFSALVFERVDAATGELYFLSLTDRGPNASPADINGSGVDARPFPLPAFTPRLVRLAVDPVAGTARYVNEILLTDAAGAPLTGLPNRNGPPGLANSDEPAIDLRGTPLAFDPLGIDPEGFAVAADGSFWVVEEYRPAILHFNGDGRLMRRYVPMDANVAGAKRAGMEMDVEALPGVLMQRTTNHGFEAAVLDGPILYAFMQSPIDNPDRADDTNAKRSRLVRIIAFNTVTEQTVGHYLYVVDGDNVDKIGDAVALGNGRFLVIERDDLMGPAARKYLYEISLDGATNLQESAFATLAGPNGGLETQLLPLLDLAGVRPVQKQLFMNLTTAGYLEADKLEGLALIDASHIALINDDDFGMSGAFDPDTGLFSLNPSATPSMLTLIDLDPGVLEIGH